MAKKKQSPKPIDIALPEGVLTGGGVMFVRLGTLDELERFWCENKGRFEYACEGRLDDGSPLFLNEYEWVFGSSKAAVVKEVLRWEGCGIQCEFYDWAKKDPKDHEDWFERRDFERADRIEDGSWTGEDEADYQADITRRTPDTYRGWWELKNLPGGIDFHDWLGSCFEELTDPAMPIADVERALQEQIFNAWVRDGDEIAFHERDGIDGVIAYWREEQANGHDYYGQENE